MMATPSDIRFLLDTNILSDLVRNPVGRIFEAITLHGESRVCTSIIAACELRFGARKKASNVLTQRVDVILANLQILPFLEAMDREYAEIRNELESCGKCIGPNDLLIAAHARHLDLTLVTANEKEFRRVPRLRVENWL